MDAATSPFGEEAFSMSSFDESCSFSKPFLALPWSSWEELFDFSMIWFIASIDQRSLSLFCLGSDGVV